MHVLNKCSLWWMQNYTGDDYKRSLYWIQRRANKYTCVYSTISSILLLSRFVSVSNPIVPAKDIYSRKLLIYICFVWSFLIGCVLKYFNNNNNELTHMNQKSQIYGSGLLKSICTSVLIFESMIYERFSHFCTLTCPLYKWEQWSLHFLSLFIFKYIQFEAMHLIRVCYIVHVQMYITFAAPVMPCASTALESRYRVRDL